MITTNSTTPEIKTTVSDHHESSLKTAAIVSNYREPSLVTQTSSWLELSARAFNHNVSHYKKAIGASLLAPVIKANAYGHGLVEVGQLCEKNNNVDWLCVVKLSEALDLRNNGITKPILVLGIIDEDPLKSVHKDIAYACSDYESAYILNAAGERTSSIINIHLKIDTGLARFGIRPHEALFLIKSILKLPFIKIQGIWSHCAESHKEDQVFTQSQIEQFNSLIKELTTNNIIIPIKHMGNSAATTAHDLSQCNFFRVGLGVYGYWPSESTQTITQQMFPDFTLQPIACWKTRIIHIKKVTAGNSIGYDRTAYAQHDTIIALLPVGYQDGYSPFLSNKGVVGINNTCAPIIGRIAMNIITIDITHIDNAYVGQEVILLGDHENYNASTLARTIEIYNPRYITTCINPAVNRVITD